MEPINTINNYEVVTNTDDLFKAPEQRFVRFWGGNVENRGVIIHSGWIVCIDANDICTTLSGSRYALGQPLSGSIEEAVSDVREALSKLSGCVDSGYHPHVLELLRGCEHQMWV